MMAGVLLLRCIKLKLECPSQFYTEINVSILIRISIDMAH